MYRGPPSFDTTVCTVYIGAFPALIPLYVYVKAYSFEVAGAQDAAYVAEVSEQQVEDLSRSLFVVTAHLLQ